MFEFIKVECIYLPKHYQFLKHCKRHILNKISNNAKTAHCRSCVIVINVMYKTVEKYACEKHIAKI